MGETARAATADIVARTRAETSPELRALAITALAKVAPRDPAWNFANFYAAVREAGYVLYPGKLTQVDTFRVGCIGEIDADDLRNAVAAIDRTLKWLGISVK